jgi:hypothetical protein
MVIHGQPVQNVPNISTNKVGMVMHDSNPSSVTGLCRRITILGWTQEKAQDCIQKISKEKNGCGVWSRSRTPARQACCLVFKLQYCQSKQKYICIIYNNS